MAAPSAPQPMPKRAWLRQLSGPRRPVTPGRRFASEISQSESERPEVTEARNDHLPWTSHAVKPVAPFSTRKPRTFACSHFAQTTETSAREPLVIHIFSPLRTYLPPFLTARVSIPPGLEPNCGSVRPKQPMALPPWSSGSHLFFWASLP